MGDAPAAAVHKPCCVCAEPGGKHCTKCKSRHYCSKMCQLVDWQRGHKEQCKQLAAKFQGRLLEELMPAKLKIKEEPAIVADFVSADGSEAAPRLPAVPTAKTTEAGVPNDDAPSWRGTCAICLELLPIEGAGQAFYSCCCKRLCTECAFKCDKYDERCPLCRAPAPKSDAEMLRRLQKHLDKGNAEAQVMLAYNYANGGMGLEQFKRAVQLYELAAAQGHAEAQNNLGLCYARGDGVEVDFKTAAQWYRRAAEPGYPDAQSILGTMFANGTGVAQSFEQAVDWFRLAAAQGDADALANLGGCYACGSGVPRDNCEALRSSSAPRPRGTPRLRRRLSRCGAGRTCSSAVRGALRSTGIIAARRLQLVQPSASEEDTSERFRKYARNRYRPPRLTDHAGWRNNRNALDQIEGP